MSNLLLITDVARLRDVFGGLNDDKDIRLRIANSLEKGAEEIASEKPDIVFVQTHLSGLSADILLMHLKKQLGRKRSSFVLLAAPNQVSETILAPYKGWLDVSSEDDVLLAELRNLHTLLTTRTKRSVKSEAAEVAPVVLPELPELPSAVTAPATDAETTTFIVPAQPVFTEPLPTPEPLPEPSLEEQGITYSPRPRLTVYSEFNSSFDNAVSSAPAPEFLAEVVPALKQDWNAGEHLDETTFPMPRSKSSTFILWLAPVILAVVVATILQQRKSSTPPDRVATVSTTPALQSPKPLQESLPVAPNKSDSVRAPSAPQPPVNTPKDKASTDKAILAAVPPPKKKDEVASTTTTAPPDKLPDFIPRYGFDKHYGATNPGWERYKGQVTEFKIYRESQTIKAIQVIDRGGQGVPESFMKGVLKQVAKNPAFTIETTEKKDGYEIQRGHLASNLKVIYYRDADGGKLRAFVINWQ